MSILKYIYLTYTLEYIHLNTDTRTYTLEYRYSIYKDKGKINRLDTRSLSIVMCFSEECKSVGSKLSIGKDAKG